MRIRHKAWAKPELEACPFYVPEPKALRGHWREQFPHPERPLYLELGCGKGGWISQAVLRYPQVNLIALDIKNEMLGLAKRKLEAAYAAAQQPAENVKIAIFNISYISDAFAPEDRVDRIYINFCNPWPRSKHKKRRLTHPRQLMQYKAFLRGELWFKTDDDELFQETLEYLPECGYRVTYQTWDLHASGFAENLETEHEKMFTDEGKCIKFLIAQPEGQV